MSLPAVSPVIDAGMALEIVGMQIDAFEERPEGIFHPGCLQAFEVLERDDRPAFKRAMSRLPAGVAREVQGDLWRMRRRRREPDEPDSSSEPRDELGAIDGDEFLAGYQPPPYVLRPVIVQGHVTAMTALPNGGKTSIAIQFSLALAGLCTLPGLEGDEPGRVLYLAGDSDINFAVQLIAACEQHGIDQADLCDRLIVIPQRFPLAGRVEPIRELAEARGGFAAVVVDTRPAYSSATEEDDNVQALLDAMALRDLTRIEGGPAVIVLCHPPKNAGRDQLLPRGGSSFMGEVDNNLTLWSEDGIVELAANKRRMPEFEPLRWRFEVVDIDRTDARGQRVRSVVACRVTDDQGEHRQSARREDENRLLHALLHHPRESVAGWARVCGWISQTGVPHKSKVARTLDRLVADRLVKKFRGTYQLTAAGKKEAAGVE